MVLKYYLIFLLFESSLGLFLLIIVSLNGEFYFHASIAHDMRKTVHNRVENEINNVFTLRQRPITFTFGQLMLSIG